jgi:hypothetical protein
MKDTDTHIKFNPTELFIGALVGVTRQVQNIQKGRVHLVNDLEGEGWNSHACKIIKGRVWLCAR